ncbi:Hypothetical predicted protein [Marmota monax]|uniref:Uncharacterized protein n=1 Tax=Marmota monax TaxID=9995 RepID=A0A5E4BKV0_MARMO|nr:hypothetical protein GHT09_010099 [Marmota monax]VTJ70323.1 Hypothetical predicted protein [Marmota monax]
MPGSNRRSPAALGPLPDALRGLCAWLDQLPLSRPKRHLTRDFSDGGRGGRRRFPRARCSLGKVGWGGAGAQRRPPSLPG